MATMTTVLTSFNNDNNTVTYSLTGHSPAKPRLVIQKRKVPGGASGVAETSIKVVYGTEDSVGDPLAQRITFEGVIRTPVQGLAADVSSALAVFRDLIACDELTNTVDTQEYLK